MSYFTNTLKTTILLAVLTGLVLLLGRWLGGTTGVLIAFAIVLLFNGIMYWFSDKIVLWMYKAKKVPTTHRAAGIVHDVSKKAGLPVIPETYLVENATPNAFATGRSPKHSAVAVTTGILTLLDDEELRGVIAHEVSHIKNRDTLIQTIAGVLAGVIAYIADMVRWSAIFGSSDDDRGGGLISILVITILAPIIAMILQMAISRAREYMADEGSARLVHSGKPLARALKKLETGNKMHPMEADNGHAATSSLFIVNPFRGSFLFELFSTHPPMDKRIAKLEAMRF